MSVAFLTSVVVYRNSISDFSLLGNDATSTALLDSVDNLASAVEGAHELAQDLLRSRRFLPRELSVQLLHLHLQ